MEQNQSRGGQRGSGGDKPSIEFACWPFRVAIWSRQKKTDGGREYTEHTCCLSKSFKRQQGDGYEEQKITIFANELPMAILALQSAALNACVDSRVP